MTDPNRKIILILDPDRDMGELFARALETSRENKCYLASEETEAMALLKKIMFSLLLADLGLLMTNDFGLFRKIRRSFPHVPIVVGAFLHQRDDVPRALEMGALGYVMKPIQIDGFRRRMRQFLVPLKGGESTEMSSER